MADSTPVQDVDHSMLNFRSDNVGSVHPQILRAMEVANHGAASSYGDDPYSLLVNERYSEIFETDVIVVAVSTGTAANAISLATVARPWGAIYCHEMAHAHKSEAGAAEFFSGGSKLMALAGAEYKIDAAVLGDVVFNAERGVRNRSQPDAVTISQATELGTVYSLDEIAAIGAVARKEKLLFHMDGARCANSLATLGCSLAELTWKSGVDILSFGVSKNGGMNAEAIVVFNPSLVESLLYRLRRAGQTWSKMRFASAQLLAYVQDGLYLELAKHANRLATRIAQGLSSLRDVQLIAPVQSNMVFVRVPERLIGALQLAGVKFGVRRGGVIRLVTRFDMTEGEAQQLLDIARSAVE